MDAASVVHGNTDLHVDSPDLYAGVHVDLQYGAHTLAHAVRDEA